MDAALFSWVQSLDTGEGALVTSRTVSCTVSSAEKLFYFVFAPECMVIPTEPPELQPNQLIVFHVAALPYAGFLDGSTFSHTRTYVQLYIYGFFCL